jgi:hypothetical protein
VTNTSSDVGFNFELAAGVSLSSPPLLSINATSLTWPEPAAFYTLYSAMSLISPVVWSPFTNMPVLSNGQWTLPLSSATNDQRFFRLSAP